MVKTKQAKVSREQDRSTLGKMVDYLDGEYHRNKDRIVLVRNSRNEIHYILENPSLKYLAHPDEPYNFQPKHNFDNSTEKHYFINLSPEYSDKFYLYIKKSNYIKDDYGKRKLPLVFSAVNSITCFTQIPYSWGKDELLAHLVEIPFSARKPVWDSSEGYYLLKSKEDETRKIHYYSNIKANRRQFLLEFSPLFLYSELPYIEKIKYKNVTMIDPDTKTKANRKVIEPKLRIDIKSSRSSDYLKDEQRSNFVALAKYIYKLLFYNLGGDENLDFYHFLMSREIPDLIEIFRRHYFKPDSVSSKRDISDEDIQYVNQALYIRHTMLQSAINLLLGYFLIFIPQKLAEKKVLSRCEHCGDYFRYQKNKKYCSALSEGKDCGKKARNKKYYKKYKDKISKYYRDEMRDTRAEIKIITERDSRNVKGTENTN